MQEGGPDMRKGSSCLVSIICSDCGKLSQKTGVIHTGFDINRRLVVAAQSIGIGFTQGLPKPMTESTWYDYKARVHLGLTEAALVHLQDAVHQIRTTYADTSLGRPDDEGVLDNTRVKTATRKSSRKERAKRTRMEIARRQEQQERQEREGPQYEAGGF